MMWRQASRFRNWYVVTRSTTFVGIRGWQEVDATDVHYAIAMIRNSICCNINYESDCHEYQKQSSMRTVLHSRSGFEVWLSHDVRLPAWFSLQCAISSQQLMTDENLFKLIHRFLYHLGRLPQNRHFCRNLLGKGDTISLPVKIRLELRLQYYCVTINSVTVMH